MLQSSFCENYGNMDEENHQMLVRRKQCKNGLTAAPIAPVNFFTYRAISRIGWKKTTQRFEQPENRETYFSNNADIMQRNEWDSTDDYKKDFFLLLPCLLLPCLLLPLRFSFSIFSLTAHPHKLLERFLD